MTDEILLDISPANLASATTGDVFRELAGLLKPKENLPIDQWVARNVYFSAKTSPFPGYWSHAQFPWSKEVLLSLVDPDVLTVVNKWGTQLGKTAILGAAIGYYLSCIPGPVLIACPEQESAREHQSLRLVPMLEQIEDLRLRLPSQHRRKASRLDLGESVVYYAWSGAKWSVSGRSARFTAITEVNLHDRRKTGEGDAVAMAEDRTKGFLNHKIYVEGKPTIVGECRLEHYYARSDQQLFVLPCPHCNAYQPLDRGSKVSKHGLRWELQSGGRLVEPDSVYYQCERCEGRIEQRHKPLMVRKGIWRPEGAKCDKDGKPFPRSKRPLHVGFALNSLYSQVISWPEYVQSYLTACDGGREKVKAFVQSWDARAYEVVRKQTGVDAVASHKLDYKRLQVPTTDESVLVMAIDTQDDCFWYTVRAWSFGATCWLVDWGRIETFKRLADYRDIQYLDPNRTVRRIDHAIIDIGGHRTASVMEFCTEHAGWIVPSKGVRQFGGKGMVYVSGRTQDDRPPIWLVDPGLAKNHFFESRLKIPVGSEGYWGIPDDVDNHFLRALTVWQRQEVRQDDGLAQMRWVSVNKEIEHFGDCEHLQEAVAFQMLWAQRHKPVVSESRPSGSLVATNVDRIESRFNSGVLQREDGGSWL